MSNITVSQNGKIVDSSKYDWNTDTKTFSTNEPNLVLDFGSMGNVTIKCGFNCNINCGDSCNINCGSYCTINCGYFCTIDCGDSCTIDCGSYCNIRTYWNTTILPGKNCSIHFQHNEIFTLEKLMENEFQQILRTGELKVLKEIEYTAISLKENVFTYILKNDQKFSFYIEDDQNEELMKAINEDNHTKILMLENENNNKFIKNFLKTFKKVIIG